MTTLAYGTTTISISDDLLWVDEYSWAAVAQRGEYTLTGALVLDAQAKQSGRPITLTGGETAGWMTRSTVDALVLAAAIPGQQFTLTLRGVAYTVVFDHEATPIEVDPVFDVSDPTSTDFYTATLRFIEV